MEAATKVVYSHDVKGNFVRLPIELVDAVEAANIQVQDVKVKLHGSELLTLGWDGFETTTNGTVEINASLAKLYSLKPGQIITTSIAKFTEDEVAIEVHLEPNSSYDWDIIEGNSQLIQDSILFQTRAVTLQKPFICYLDSMIATFKVTRIVPENVKTVKLTDGTLVVVAPKLNTKSKQKLKNSVPEKCKRLVKSRLCEQQENLEGLTVIIRGEPEKESEYGCISVKRKLHVKNKDPYLRQIPVRVCYSDLVAQEHVLIAPLVWQCLALTAANNELFELWINTINVQVASSPEDITLIFRPFGSNQHHHTSESKKKSEISQLLDQLKGSLIATDLVLTKQQCVLEIKSNNGEKVPVVDLKDLSHPLEKFLYLNSEPKDISLPPDVLHFSQLHDFGDINVEPIQSVLEVLEEQLLSPLNPAPAFLVEGESGMGKTMLFKYLQRRLATQNQLNVMYIDCNDLLKYSSFEKLRRFWGGIISSCYWTQPAVILMDNADSVFPTTKSDDAQQQAQMQSPHSLGNVARQTLVYLVETLTHMNTKSRGCVRVVLGAAKKYSLDAMFFDTHFVCETYSLKAPNRDQRAMYLQGFCGTHGEGNTSAYGLCLDSRLDWADIAAETEGFSVRDLKMFSEMLYYRTVMAQRLSQDGSGLVDQVVLDSCVKDFTPSSLRGVQLTKGTGVRWDSIGALQEAKQILLETLEWPTRYAPVFAKCPLRLRSGLLLYGYPGCGKTLLAGAVAHQCGLNFISVKGPEILDKYIGASEQNVRELFERAQSVRPCVLFFDEFDAIAPKRGHDSTGVTDRVVNQLLTQMDGAEGLEGVYVLAATSRPDLIDAALLRPGRLDRSVLCDMPDESARLDILRAITREQPGGATQLRVAADVDLAEIARGTRGFSGADLQSLCYNAYLKAVQRQLAHVSTTPTAEQKATDHMEYVVLPGNDTTITADQIRKIVASRKGYEAVSDYPNGTSGSSENSAQNPDIQAADLQEALQETKPSVSATELARLRTVYANFASDRTGEMPAPHTDPADIGTKLSLM